MFSDTWISIFLSQRTIDDINMQVVMCAAQKQNPKSLEIACISYLDKIEDVLANRTSRNSATETMAILVRHYCSIVSSMWLSLLVTLCDSAASRSILSEQYIQPSTCMQKTLNQNVNFVYHSIFQFVQEKKRKLLRHCLSDKHTFNKTHHP